MITQTNTLLGIWNQPAQCTTLEMPVADYMDSADVTDEEEFHDEIVSVGPVGELRTPVKEYVEY